MQIVGRHPTAGFRVSHGEPTVMNGLSIYLVDPYIQYMAWSIVMNLSWVGRQHDASFESTHTQTHTNPKIQKPPAWSPCSINQKRIWERTQNVLGLRSLLQLLWGPFKVWCTEKWRIFVRTPTTPLVELGVALFSILSSTVRQWLLLTCCWSVHSPPPATHTLPSILNQYPY